MYKITETELKEMPEDLQSLYTKLPNESREEVVGLFPESKDGVANPNKKGKGWFDTSNGGTYHKGYGSFGSAARFFYCAKASKKDRDEGLEGFAARTKSTLGSFGNQSDFDCPDGANRVGNKGDSSARNFHPTVKPTNLMRYLCRLVTPKGGTILDPFMGSGSTGKAARLEGFDFIGIELDEDYYKIAQKRIHDSSN